VVEVPITGGGYGAWMASSGNSKVGLCKLNQVDP
jgi:hypothetical protein